jgi:hypothetical protein
MKRSFIFVNNPFFPLDYCTLVNGLKNSSVPHKLFVSQFLLFEKTLAFMVGASFYKQKVSIRPSLGSFVRLCREHCFN